jgi:hypothetical protein
LHGLVVIGSEAFLVDPDDQLDLLGAFDPALRAEDLTALAFPPDDLLDELAALDDDAVVAATSTTAVPAPATTGAGSGSAPPPQPDDRIDRPAPPGTGQDPDGATGASVADRLADVAASGVAEEVTATVGKMLGINKGTTRSLFRAFRKGRR